MHKLSSLPRFHAASPPVWQGIGGAHLACLCLAFAVMLAASAAISAPTGRAILVQNDGGGDLATRIEMIKALRTAGDHVEIRRGYCVSACTLFLGLEGTCIGPEAEFGFHGPGTGVYGLGLPPPEFEHWSRVMASYYPEPLRGWFMRTGRMRTVGFYRISGRELIRMGVPACG